jgi:hypothetical protein
MEKYFVYLWLSAFGIWSILLALIIARFSHYEFIASFHDFEDKYFGANCLIVMSRVVTWSKVLYFPFVAMMGGLFVGIYFSIQTFIKMVKWKPPGEFTVKETERNLRKKRQSLLITQSSLEHYLDGLQFSFILHTNQFCSIPMKTDCMAIILIRILVHSYCALSL